MSKKIVVMDSGIGGASILKEIRELLPAYSYLYFADTKNAPYGNKTKAQVLEIVVKNVLKINKKNEILALVLACNTASSACSKSLRKMFNFPIICVEPPIKKAIDLKYKNILILATEGTLKTNLTIKKYTNSNQAKIQKFAPKNLAKLIDRNVENLNLVIPYLKKELENKKCDCAVLGCTHYNFLKNKIKAILKCPVITCEKAVARQTKKVLDELKISAQKPKLKIKLSKQNFKIRRFLKTYLNS